MRIDVHTWVYKCTCKNARLNIRHDLHPHDMGLSYTQECIQMQVPYQVYLITWNWEQCLHMHSYTCASKKTYDAYSHKSSDMHTHTYSWLLHPSQTHIYSHVGAPFAIVGHKHIEWRQKKNNRKREQFSTPKFQMDCSANSFEIRYAWLRKTIQELGNNSNIRHVPIWLQNEH